MFNISTIRCSWNFNPRPPCGGRRCISAYCNWEAEISIHAPRAGGDTTEIDIAVRAMLFQSTPPVRGATRRSPCFRRTYGISIHAPRAGGDAWAAYMAKFEIISIHAPRAGGDLRRNLLLHEGAQDFNPRPPCGGRHAPRLLTGCHCHFNPRPPCGGRRLCFGATI